MKDKILNIVLASALAIAILVLFYVVLFKMDDAGKMTALEFTNSGLIEERDRYKKLVDDGKSDCDKKIADAKIIWKRNRDVKDDIEHGSGGMVEFELGGVR